MRLILGLFPSSPPASSPFLPPRSLPRTGPLLRSGSRACFRACPALVSVPVPSSSPFLPPRSLPRTGPLLHSGSRACFRACPCVCPAPVSVPVPVLVPAPASIPASVPVPAPVSAPRRSLSQSLPRSPTRFCLSCSSFRSFRLPGTQSRLPHSSPAFSLDSSVFLCIPFFSSASSTLPPSFFRFVRDGTVVFLNF